MPVAPEFQDPPVAGNSPPFLVRSTPNPGSSNMAEQDFSVTASDFNTRDRLYVRWVSDYPPYLQASSKLLESKETTPSTIPTATYQVPTDCANFKPVPQPYHRLVVIISDRRFMDPDLAENSEYRFNATEEKTYPLMLSWTVTCPQ